MKQELKQGTTTTTLPTTTTTAATTIIAASTRPKAKGIVIPYQVQAPTPTVSSQQSSHVKDNSKAKMVELEPVKKMSKKDQIMLDEELALKLQAEEEEEERLAREKDQQVKEANISWDNVVNTFVDMDTKLVEESSKKAKAEESSSKREGDELKPEVAKKQKMDKDKETTKLQKLMKVVPDEEGVAINVIPLATKTSCIVDLKIRRKEKQGYYQITRADGSYYCWCSRVNAAERLQLLEEFMLSEDKDHLYDKDCYL
ncbi:hypothetical protein Tco_1016953 [Tanacetum coccineum]|uniref:Uncharacterized protein n=1 Tax=Tanacetum coccineum TaxID=301880 RepID=A0ABQ5FQ40_9ASTR